MQKARDWVNQHKKLTGLAALLTLWVVGKITDDLGFNLRNVLAPTFWNSLTGAVSKVGRWIGFSEIYTIVPLIIGIVYAAYRFVRVLISGLFKLHRDLPKLQDTLDIVKDRTSRALEGAIKALEACFDLRVNKKLLCKELINETTDAVSAIGFCLRNWTKLPSARADAGDIPISRIWLRAMRTYHYEEAYDVAHKMLATNGRNFPFLILSTLQALVSELPSNSKVCYYAVTPANPKDMYNWPHGHDKDAPKEYYEEDFMGLFHRALREAIAANPGKIEHGRFVLGLKDPDIANAAFGWTPDGEEGLKRVADIVILPVTVTVQQLLDSNDAFNKALGKFYEIVAADSSRLVTPMFCAKWNHSKHKNDGSVGGRKRAERIETTAINVNACSPTAAGANELIEAARVGLLDQIKASLHSLAVLGNNPSIIKLNGCLTALEELWKSSTPDDVISFLQLCHEVEAVLSEQQDAVQLSRNIRDIRTNVLRLRDIYWVNRKYNGKWTMLNEVFSASWHTADNLAKYGVLNSNAYHEWPVKPEFSIFGIRENGQEPAWKLVIATDLDPPFEVALIQLLEKGDEIERKGKKAKFEDYEKLIESLIAEKPELNGGQVTYTQWK